MDSRIRLNFVKYTLLEFALAVFLLVSIYWLFDGNPQSLPTIGLMFSAVAVLKVVMLWWQFRNRSFEVSNNHVCFDGHACDIKLQEIFFLLVSGLLSSFPTRRCDAKTQHLPSERGNEPR